MTVQLIDVANGKPASERGVLVYRVNPDTHVPIVEQGLPLKGITDKDGKATFPVAPLRSVDKAGQGASGMEGLQGDRKSLSKFLDIEIVYAGGGVQCSSGLFSLSEILASGVVGDNRCNKKFNFTQFNASPGEAIIFVGKYHWWQAGQT